MNPRGRVALSSPPTMTEMSAAADSAPETPRAASTAAAWEELLDNLRKRYPGQKDSVLFCVFKLHQNPELSLRDFRDEAKLHGIGLAGRSLHSARVLLGLATARPSKPRASKPDQATRTSAAPRGVSNAAQGDAVEAQLLALVRQMQAPLREQNERLRAAIAAALEVIAEALDEE